MPTITEALSLALQHHQAGRLQEAEAICRQILQVQPQHPDALHLLGVIAHQVGQHQSAVDCISRAIGLNPNIAEFHNSIGEAYRAQGELGEATASYQKALTLNPSYAEAYCNLGIILRWQGKLEEAISHYRQALALKPSLAEAHNNLAATFQAQGKLAEAIASYQRALAFRPNYADAQINLAVALRSQGRAIDAIQLLFDGLKAQPMSVPLRRALAESLRGVSLGTAGEPERSILLSLCGDDNISMLDIGIAIIGFLKNAPAFPFLLKAAQIGKDPFTEVALGAEAFMRDPLLLAALPRITIWDADLECILTQIRRWILLRQEAQDGRSVVGDYVPYDFVCALVRQCFNTGYAFFVAEDESKLADALRIKLQKALEKHLTPQQHFEQSLALVALYGPLHQLKGSKKLLEPPILCWSEPFRHVLADHLINRRREQEIAVRLTAITEIEDSVSRAVGLQYEESPYPVWTSVHNPRPLQVEEFASRLRPGDKLHRFARPVAILVAGCGTGHHPIQVARSFNDCEVLAVDLSRASLAYAVRMAECFGVSNISFRQADILKLSKFDRRFAVIECVGVLHHLKDPLAGWRALINLLEPDGLMKIGLYSKKARRSILAASEFIREQKFPLTPDGIRQSRRAIINLPDGHPARGALTFGDFFTLYGCRDLILHVQEHTFTLLEIAVCLDTLGLRFLGFQCEPEISKCFREMFPGNNALTDLMLWDHFEDAYPDAFKSMYQFWCCRKQQGGVC